MMHRHADPAELVHSSRLVAEWKRRQSTRAAAVEAGDEQAYDQADVRWYAFLRTMARPVPNPVCEACEDTGMLMLECTINARCNGRMCEARDKRSDSLWTHSFARACECEAGMAYRGSFAAAHRAESSRPRPAATSHQGLGQPVGAHR